MSSQLPPFVDLARHSAGHARLSLQCKPSFQVRKAARQENHPYPRENGKILFVFIRLAVTCFRPAMPTCFLPTCFLPTCFRQASPSASSCALSAFGYITIYSRAWVPYPSDIRREKSAACGWHDAARRASVHERRFMLKLGFGKKRSRFRHKNKKGMATTALNRNYPSKKVRRG